MAPTSPHPSIHLPELPRRHPGLLPEGRYEVADIMVACQVADALYLQVGLADEQFFCLIDPEAGDIAADGITGEALEEACQVLGRDMDPGSQVIDIEIFGIFCFDFFDHGFHILLE